MPGTEKQPPVLLDMATSRIALGKARVALNKNEGSKMDLLSTPRDNQAGIPE
ncbi:MAG: hypothetical protein Ct9H300mP21_10230 [Pseudomonadota bacterium]|nr:MAG: hypothetical protein Ct9H300mP21_10230 [Pseudomonadota bacterium]